MTLGQKDGASAITGIKLTVRGEVEGLDAAGFEKAAQAAKAGCPVSKALTGVEITLDAALDSSGTAPARTRPEDADGPPPVRGPGRRRVPAGVSDGRLEGRRLVSSAAARRSGSAARPRG